MADEGRFREQLLAEAGLPACLNCGAPMTGPFCASCGQRDIPPYPSARELAVDAVSEFSGWDGRLASTLRALVQHPGLLTHEFLEGRRVRYISPLRLYLTSSLVYFLIAAATPDVRLDSGKMLLPGVQVRATRTQTSASSSRPERVANAASASLEKGAALSQGERDSALKDIERAPQIMRPFLRRAILDPGGVKRGILTTMPRMLFALLPIFAGIVALFYRGRKYPEHLYFAIHLHAFTFLALSLAEVLKFTHSPILVAIGSLIGVIWLPIYAVLAFRRVYGGSYARTIAKVVAIGAIYAAATAVAFVILIYWVSIAA
jgi:Protein of unknown function (DUF3667)